MDRRIATMIETIEGWAYEIEHIGEAGVLPADCELAADNTIFVVLRPSDVAFQCLQSAITHLNFLAHWLKVTGRQWHQVHFTILRTALMGSAQALYVIGPTDRATRQARAIQLMCNDFKYEKQLLTSGLTPGEGSNERLAALAEYLVDAESKGRRLKQSVSPITTTKMIEEAVVLMPSQGDIHEMFTRAIDILWRGGSAHAHAAPYLKFSTMPVKDKAVRADETEVGRGQLSESMLYGLTGCVQRIFAQALSLYKQRSAASVQPGE
jgi:hypothetical protein